MLRRKARESTLQILYGLEFHFDPKATSTLSADQQLKIFLENFSEKNPYYDEKFTNRILTGTMNEIQNIDHYIESSSEHWKLSRMTAVDRNILRFSIFELLHCNDVPASVTINEAVEIAKRFGTENSGSFINGILDHIWKHLPPNPDKVKE